MMFNEEQTSSNNYYFPRELIVEVISWLPVLSLLRFSCVSKLWCDLIKDPEFIKLHLHRSLESNSNATFVYRSPVRRNYNFFYYENYNHYSLIKFRSEPPYRLLVSSCNGLIIVSHDHVKIRSSPEYFNDYFLHNPATQAYKILPRVDYNSYLGMETDIFIMPRTVELGYDSVSDDYKVLRIDDSWQWRNDKGASKTSYITLLYSLKGNAWEIINNPPWDDEVRIGSKASIVFVNNCFHWLNPKSNEAIRCLDISTKTYYKIHVPEQISNYSPTLTTFKGKLCIVTYRLDIWILHKYGDNMLWTRLFCNASYDHTKMSKVIGTAFTGVDCLQPKDGPRNIVILGLRTLNNSEQREWFRCDLESGEAKKICMPRLSQDLRLANLHQWVESVVPLV